MKTIKIFFLFLIFVVLFCGCFEDSEIHKNYSITNKNKSNIENSSNCYDYNNTVYNPNYNFNNSKLQNITENKIKNSSTKLLNYEIIAYGSFGEKQSSYYYYNEYNKTFIVINLGEMPTAGYKINIINVTKTSNGIIVYYNVTPPKDFVAMVITYPYIEICVNGSYNHVVCRQS